MNVETAPIANVATVTAPNGWNQVTSTCPFCEAVSVASQWRMYGPGKRCKCGAVHKIGSDNQAFSERIAE